MRPKTVSASFKSFSDFDAATRDKNIQVTKDGVELIKSVLLTDEVGRCTDRDREILRGSIWAKKEFMIDDPDVFSAKLCPYLDCERAGSILLIDVNGRTISYRLPEKMEYWQGRWAPIDVPVEYLRRGLNEIVLRSKDDAQWVLFIENSLSPNRSAKSIDGGRTWNYDVMGANDSADGEYLIRLWLERYAHKGIITSPKIDIASLGADGVIRPRIEIQAIRLDCEAVEPEGTGITLEQRMGSTPSYSPETWSSWRPVTGPFSPEDPSAQHLQWRAILTTDNPKATPKLHGVVVEADIHLDSADGLRVVEYNNEEIVRSSYHFAYQPYEERRVKVLRGKWGLEEVVRGARTEFEKFLLLRDWVRHQWEDGWNKDWGSIGYCPPWDGLVILELASRNLSLGMCTHYATVFTHCCVALGLTARTQIMRAHCINEVWSNDYKKWICMDVGGDSNDKTKVTYHFERDGIPLSALEAHQAWLRKDFDAVRIVPERAASIFKVADRLSLFDRFMITLRNDELTSLEPGEPEHGAGSYHYDRYLWWKDDGTPPLPWFSRHTDRVADLYWTLNQTEIHLQKSKQEGDLDVQLDTVTPNFAKFVVSIDGGDWTEKSPSFVWELHKGTNSLKAKTVNKFGLEGIVSSVVLENRDG